MSKPAAIVLAAGESRRFGRANKLLVLRQGTTMVRRVVDTAIAAGLQPVIVVIGHDAEQVADALTGADVELARNDAYATGQSSSLQTGLARVPEASDGAAILLGDMPDLRVETLRQLIDEFDGPTRVVAPYAKGRRGNPVIWGRDHFARLMQVGGDEGARKVLNDVESELHLVHVDDDGVLRDYDTPDSIGSRQDGR